MALVTRSTIPISFLGWQNRKEWENGDRHVTAEELHGVAVTRLSGSTTSLDTSRSWPRGPSVAAAGVMVPSPRRLPHSISPLEGSGFEPSVPRQRTLFEAAPFELAFPMGRERDGGFESLFRHRRLSHPMDPRTVPLYVPREDRELVTNARCIADVDDKV